MKDDERDDRGRDALEDGAAGVERELRRLAPMAVPPGLRGRVIARAAEARRGTLLAPWMRVSAVACSVLIATVFVTDPLIGRLEEARLAALLDGRSAVAAPGDTAAELAEVVLGQGSDAGRLARLQTMAASAIRKSAQRGFFEARKGLKGWHEDETSENPD
jgi:hypothetical protein